MKFHYTTIRLQFIHDMMTRYVLTTIWCYFTEAQDILFKYRHLFTRLKVIFHFNYE